MSFLTGLIGNAYNAISDAAGEIANSGKTGSGTFSAYMTAGFNKHDPLLASALRDQGISEENIPKIQEAVHDAIEQGRSAGATDDELNTSIRGILEQYNVDADVLEHYMVAHQPQTQEMKFASGPRHHGQHHHRHSVSDTGIYG